MHWSYAAEYMTFLRLVRNYLLHWQSLMNHDSLWVFMDFYSLSWKLMQKWCWVNVMPKSLEVLKAPVFFALWQKPAAHGSLPALRAPHYGKAQYKYHMKGPHVGESINPANSKNQDPWLPAPAGLPANSRTSKLPCEWSSTILEVNPPASSWEANLTDTVWGKRQLFSQSPVQTEESWINNSYFEPLSLGVVIK